MGDYDVLVVGGGAAGIMAAIRAGQLGASVAVLEKTKQLGTKILISGGGKCNVAHDGPLEDVLRAFRKNETLFIRPACYKLPNHQIIEFMQRNGLEVYTRPDGRVFPVHQTAKDVVKILEYQLERAGVKVARNTPVVGLETQDSHVTGVWTGTPPAAHSGYRVKSLERDRFWPSKIVILATGGSSYPNCGTTGDGWDWARAIGHRIVPVRSALAPIYLEISPDRVELSGIALRNMLVKARCAGKEIARWRGDVLFTHQGVSGPAILGISRVVAEQSQPVELSVDLSPDQTFEEVAARVRDLPNSIRLGKWLAAILPERVAGEFARDLDVALDRSIALLDKKTRNRLVEAIKGWNLGQVRSVPLEKGECVAGGISLDEVDAKTMESKLIKGLYIAGEVLDVAGPVGGYNLQAAFATGWLAGETAAQAVLASRDPSLR